MPACPSCSSSDLTRDGHDQRGRVIRACRASGRHATSESRSLVAGHRFPRDVILLAVRYYRQLGATAERGAGILADRGVDVSGRTILRWVQKVGPALSDEIRGCRKPVSTTWLVDETYVKIRGRWHYLYRGIDADGQVLDGWLSHTRDLAAAEVFFRRTISSTGCMPEHVVTDKATFYPSAIRTCTPGAKHTATRYAEASISAYLQISNNGDRMQFVSRTRMPTPLELEVLRAAAALMARGQSCFYGYELACHLEDADGAFRRTGFSNLYRTLDRLEAAELLLSEWDVSNSRPRRLYRLTDAGARCAANFAGVNTAIRLSPRLVI